MYYGGYSNGTLKGLVDYNMQLAYFFTTAIYMVLCGIVLLFRSVQLSVQSVLSHDFFSSIFINVWLYSPAAWRAHSKRTTHL